MATTISDLLITLNTELSDTANTTFTAAEKTQFLTKAINDPYVYSVTRDTSLTTLASTYSYTAPTGLDAIFELGLNIDGDGIFHQVPREDYDLINGVIYFNTNSLPTGKTIQIVGKSKLTTVTSDFPTKVQDYIIELSIVNAFEFLKTKLTTRFLKNDMTMADIINSISTHKQRAAELRQALINQRLVTL